LGFKQTEISYFLHNYKSGSFLRVTPLCKNRWQFIDFRNATIQSSPGLQYQREGTAGWYASEWKVVTCLNLQGDSNNIDAQGQHIELTVTFSTNHSNL